jgi:putative oxidoreductase
MQMRIPAAILKPVLKLLDFITPFANLLARFWVAAIFFQAGLVKIQSWQTTIELFTNQYQVPLLSPVLAAYIGTGFELILPIFLILGLGGRFLIFLFFVYNIMCVVSYHFLLTMEGQAGLASHINWGLLLLLLMCYGTDKLSLDYLIHKKWGHHLK